MNKSVVVSSGTYFEILRKLYKNEVSARYTLPFTFCGEVIVEITVDSYCDVVLPAVVVSSERKEKI